MRFLIENNNPVDIIAYHGSPSKFAKFDLSKAGSNTDSGMYGKGIYFTNDLDLAKSWNDHGYLYKCKLKFNNPFISNNSGDISKYYKIIEYDNSLDIQKLIKAGYDGLISNNEEWTDPRTNRLKGIYNQYVCTNPNQIKILEITKY